MSKPSFDKLLATWAEQAHSADEAAAREPMDENAKSELNSKYLNGTLAAVQTELARQKRATRLGDQELDPGVRTEGPRDNLHDRWAIAVAIRVLVAVGLAASTLILLTELLGKTTTILEKWPSFQKSLDQLPDSVRWTALGLLLLLGTVAAFLAKGTSTKRFL